MTNQKGYLTARYISTDSYDFELNEVYRLQYNYQNGIMTVKSALNFKRTYDSLSDFRKAWDMDNIPERYKAANPDLGDKPM